MPPKNKSGRKPNSGKHNIDARLSMVRDWILNDLSTSDIISKGYKLWGLDKRSIHRYIKTVRESFQEKNAEVLEEKRAYYLERSRKMLSALPAKIKKTPSGIFAQMAVLQFQAKIEGVMVEKHDHSHTFEGEVYIGGQQVSPD